MDLGLTVKFAKALANEFRLKLIQLLLEQELCVCELETITGIRQANISQHLRILLSAGIVKKRRVGQLNFYSLQKGFCQERIKDLENLVTLSQKLPIELQKKLAKLSVDPKISKCKKRKLGRDE